MLKNLYARLVLWLIRPALELKNTQQMEIMQRIEATTRRAVDAMVRDLNRRA